MIIRVLTGVCLFWMFIASAKADFNSVVADIVRESKPFLKTLSRSVDVYSYATREKAGLADTGTIDSQDLRISSYIKAKSEVFWNLEKQNMDEADTNGLYAAVDPVASREKFGKEYWLMLRFRLPSGYSYLDLTEMDPVSSKELFAPIRSQLEALDCDPDSAKSFRHLFMKNISVACRKIALEVLSQLKVASFLYDWSAVDFRDCSNRKTGAFVLLNLETLEKGAAQAFMAEIPKEDPSLSERLAIEALFHQVTGPASPGPGSVFTIPEKFWPWPELDEHAKTFEVKTWLKDHLMYCD